MKTVLITLEMEVPDEATDQDITDYIDVEFCWINSMKIDNPCKDKAEVTAMLWEHEQY